MVQMIEMEMLTEQNQIWSFIATRMEVGFPRQLPTELFEHHGKPGIHCKGQEAHQKTFHSQ